MTVGPALELRGVGVRRDGRWILQGVDWTVAAGERWAVVGPNGSGKTTLLRIASTYLWPTSGSVRVLGEQIGAVDARTLRERIGFVSAALAAEIDPALGALDVVLSARRAALAPWWATFDAQDEDRATAALLRMGLEGLERRSFGSLSSGERQRVLIARTLVREPELLLLDEPAAGLDLAGREALVGRLSDLVGDRSIVAVVLVTHHLEEIPAGFDRALVVHDGRSLAAGALEATITGPVLSTAFGLPLEVTRTAGRWAARAPEQRGPAASLG